MLIAYFINNFNGMHKSVIVVESYLNTCFILPISICLNTDVRYVVICSFPYILMCMLINFMHLI